MERITLNRKFRHGKRLLKLLHPGTYRVGPDITKELAAEIVKSGAATRVVEPVTMKSKGLAPENKSLDARNHLSKVE